MNRMVLSGGTLAFALLLLSPTMAGCGTVSAPGAHPNEPSTAPSQVVQGESLLLDMYEATEGTLEQRRSAAQVEYERVQGLLTDCMSRDGIRYFPPAPVDIYAGWDQMILPDPYPEFAAVSRDGFGIADRVRRAAAQAEPDARPTAGSFASLSEAEQRTYNEALDDCVEDPALADPPRPEIVQSLTESLLALYDDVMASDAVTAASADYPSCIARHGLGERTRTELYEEASSRFASFDPVQAHYLGRAASAPGAAGWDSAVDFERLAAAADAECRSDAHALTMSLLAPRLVQFTERHAGELTRARAYWASFTP